MTLDTDQTAYLCHDATNGTIYLLLPKNCQLEVSELRLDDPDPSSTDAAEFRLLRDEMMETHVEL